MPDSGDAITIRMLDGIAEMPAEAWDACAGTGDPFVMHGFLAALEASQSAVAKTGWAPRHLVAEDSAGRVMAVVPMYLKSHSYGEYIFDHGWADAYQRAGGRYYPKLLVAVPFTPVPGRRILLRPHTDAEATRAALIRALEQIGERVGVSSLHVNFCTADEAEVFRQAGWLVRQGRQFHWANNGYKSFDDFLAEMSHSRRKAIKRERRGVTEQGLTVDVLTGAALERRHMDAFFQFYMDTGERKWGRPYLTRDFFHRLVDTMADRVALMLARDGDHYVAGALNLIGADALYGRNWGSDGQYPFLHFETCYYKAIEFAIARGLPRVEAGVQGEHKIQRGYLPVATYSAHWIADPAFKRAIQDFLKRETVMVQHDMDELAELGPFKENTST